MQKQKLPVTAGGWAEGEDIELELDISSSQTYIENIKFALRVQMIFHWRAYFVGNSWKAVWFLFISAMQIALVLEGAGLKCPGASSFQYTRVTFEAFRGREWKTQISQRKGEFLWFTQVTNTCVTDYYTLQSHSSKGVFFQSMHVQLYIQRRH